MIEFISPAQIKQFVRDQLSTGPILLKPMSGGLLNQNVLVTSADAKFVVKVYRPEMNREKVDEMHRLMAHCAKRGIPVCLPCKQSEVDGFVLAAYPFTEGQHPPRHRKTQETIAEMGAMLGRIDKALDAFRPKEERPASLAPTKYDPTVLLQRINELRQILLGKSVSLRREVNANLDVYEKLTQELDWPDQGFADLPLRVCHGDFHGYNILMREGKIDAVLDWEKSGWDWRGFELMRSILFNCRYDEGRLSWPLIETYIKAYRNAGSVLSSLECSLAFECGFRRTFFSLWAIKRYIDGNADIRGHVIRRIKLFVNLAKHRAEYAERTADLLK